MPVAKEAKAFTASDGCSITFYEAGPLDGSILLLIHGWSGSHRSFDLNYEGLAEQGLRVVLIDLRFHGDSDKPPQGLHVHRLAADVRELLDVAAPGQRVVMLGTSMGCAVIWAFCELFGTKLLKGACFVDQAPLQNRVPGWDIGSKGCYDQETLNNLGADLRKDLGAFADGNVEFCANKPLPTAYTDVLRSETLKCSAEQLWGLMRDHTQHDWRPTLPMIDVPCLNLYGSDSKVFPQEGCAYVGAHIPKCESKVYAGCNHWLYMESPKEFVADVAAFVQRL